jgi:hypothetical protein
MVITDASLDSLKPIAGNVDPICFWQGQRGRKQYTRKLVLAPILENYSVRIPLLISFSLNVL